MAQSLLSKIGFREMLENFLVDGNDDATTYSGHFMASQI
jgi:hypothetical protein